MFGTLLGMLQYAWPYITAMGLSFGAGVWIYEKYAQEKYDRVLLSVQKKADEEEATVAAFVADSKAKLNQSDKKLEECCEKVSHATTRQDYEINNLNLRVTNLDKGFDTLFSDNGALKTSHVAIASALKEVSEKQEDFEKELLDQKNAFVDQKNAMARDFVSVEALAKRQETLANELEVLQKSLKKSFGKDSSSAKRKDSKERDIEQVSAFQTVAHDEVDENQEARGVVSVSQTKDTFVESMDEWKSCGYLAEILDRLDRERMGIRDVLSGLQAQVCKARDVFKRVSGQEIQESVLQIVQNAPPELNLEVCSTPKERVSVFQKRIQWLEEQQAVLKMDVEKTSYVVGAVKKDIEQLGKEDVEDNDVLKKVLSVFSKAAMPSRSSSRLKKKRQDGIDDTAKLFSVHNRGLMLSKRIEACQNDIRKAQVDAAGVIDGANSLWNKLFDLVQASKGTSETVKAEEACVEKKVEVVEEEKKGSQKQIDQDASIVVQPGESAQKEYLFSSVKKEGEADLKECGMLTVKQETSDNSVKQDVSENPFCEVEKAKSAQGESNIVKAESQVLFIKVNQKDDGAQGEGAVVKAEDQIIKLESQIIKVEGQAEKSEELKEKPVMINGLAPVHQKGTENAREDIY